MSRSRPISRTGKTRLITTAAGSTWGWRISFDAGMHTLLLKSTRPCMGEVLEITLVGVDSRRGREVLDAAFAEATSVERRLSVFDPSSDVSRLNREGGSVPVRVAPDVLWFIEEALRLSSASGGAVDPTVAPLTRVWRNREDRIGGGPLGPPPIADLSRAASTTGAAHVEVDRGAGTVAFRTPGVELEFGAMGKGYAVDRVVSLLRRYEISSALVHFGSTTYALGRPPGKGAWRVGIRNPLDPPRLSEVVKLSDRAIATSANDQQIGRATSELQSPTNLVCRLLLEKKKKKRGPGQKQPEKTRKNHRKKENRER